MTGKQACLLRMRTSMLKHLKVHTCFDPGSERRQQEQERMQ